MPVIGRRVSAIETETGEVLLVYSEPAKYSIPSFYLYDREREPGYTINNPLPFLQQEEVWPLGTRLTYFTMTRDGRHNNPPTPILVFHQDAVSANAARPLKTTLLHNTIDPTIRYDKTTKLVHLFWWWNAWSPDFSNEWRNPNSPPPSPLVDPNLTETLPQPPTYFATHSPPDEQTPAWLRSLVPKRVPEPFDPRRPFWVAPLPDGYLFDYFPEESNVIGESKVGGPNRIPDTPGARMLQSLISRGLVEYPPPPGSPDLSSNISAERDDWERRGGIVAAGSHIREASKRDKPEFQPTPGQNYYTSELEMAHLPGMSTKIPQACTIEDHLLIINALKAHYDNANLVNTHRVLMYARGRIYENIELETNPKSWESTDPETNLQIKHPHWPGTVEIVKGQSVLILDPPKVVGHYPVKTNYRTVANPDMVTYPVMDFPEFSAYFYNDGFLHDTPTKRTQQEPALDWTIMDPTPAAGRNFDIFRNNLDLRSY
jgi:hypothetical protein